MGLHQRRRHRAGAAAAQTRRRRPRRRPSPCGPHRLGGRLQARRQRGCIGGRRPAGLGLCCGGCHPQPSRRRWGRASRGRCRRGGPLRGLWRGREGARARGRAGRRGRPARSGAGRGGAGAGGPGGHARVPAGAPQLSLLYLQHVLPCGASSLVTAMCRDSMKLLCCISSGRAVAPPADLHVRTLRMQRSQHIHATQQSAASQAALTGLEDAPMKTMLAVISVHSLDLQTVPVRVAAHGGVDPGASAASERMSALGAWAADASARLRAWGLHLVGVGQQQARHVCKRNVGSLLRSARSLRCQSTGVLRACGHAARS